MKKLIPTTATLLLAAACPLLATAQSSGAKPGNCAILAEMSADTVQKDKRFDGHKDIAPSLMKFAKAQTAKMEAAREQTYETSKAFGLDKAKVDQMMEANDAGLRQSFFTGTMDKNKLYMDHVQAVYGCATAQNTSQDLGQPPEAILATLKKMSQIVLQ